MKRLKYLFIVGILLIIGGQSMDAANKKEKQQQVKDLIESGNFTIDVNRALPASGRSINLTSPYSLEIKGDSVVSYLPYFGRAYSVPYGGGEGLRFDGRINNYTLDFDKKGTAKIQFKTTTREDNFVFNIQIFNNGSASVSVTPTNRQHITFTGELEIKEALIGLAMYSSQLSVYPPVQ